MFDPIAHTDAGLPSVIQFLWNEYLEYLKGKIEEREDEGKPTVTIEEAVRRAPAVKFCEFATEYLRVKRPVQAFWVDNNQGVVLQNNKRFVISPGIDIRGTMQDSGAVEVTHGLSQEGQDMADGGRTFGI